MHTDFDKNKINGDQYSANIDSSTPDSSPSYSPLESFDNGEEQFLFDQSLSFLEKSPSPVTSNDLKESKSPFFPINNILSNCNMNLTCESRTNKNYCNNFEIIKRSNNYIQIEINSNELNSQKEVELVLGNNLSYLKLIKNSAKIRLSF